MNTPLFRTPHYVLMDGSRRIGPALLHGPGECVGTPIYGFSDKGPYDAFCLFSKLTLRPYPLVKRYLQGQVGAMDEGLKLVVVDAAGPDDPCLHAATMQAVLEAHEERSAYVTAAYRLVFDQRADGYRLETAAY